MHWVATHFSLEVIWYAKTRSLLCGGQTMTMEEGALQGVLNNMFLYRVCVCVLVIVVNHLHRWDLVLRAWRPWIFVGDCHMGFGVLFVRRGDDIVLCCVNRYWYFVRHAIPLLRFSDGC